MSSHRFWIAGMIAWMLLFISIPVMFSTIVIHSWVFLLTGLLAVCGMLIPGRLINWLAAITCITYASTLSFIGTSNSSFWILETMIEISGILIVWLMVRKVNSSFLQFEEALAQIIMMDQGMNVKSETMVLDQMKREFGRARRYERPLSLVSIEPDYTSSAPDLQQLLEEMIGRLNKQLLKGQLAELFTSQTKENDIISYRDGKFLIMLPETDTAQAKAMANRVLTLCRETLELSVIIGTATFPSEEITLSGLISRTARNPQPVEISFDKKQPLKIDNPISKDQEEVLQHT